MLSVRLSPDATAEIQTASDVSEKETASIVSEVISEVLMANTQSQPVQRGSPTTSESVRTAADSSAVNSPLSSVHTSLSAAQHASPVQTAVDSSAMDTSLSSVHTSPSLQHQQPTVKSQQQPSPDDQGLSLCGDVL